MVEKAKEAIVQRIRQIRGISRKEAEEIVQEAQYAVNDFLAGESTYKSVEAIIDDYLDLPPKYAWIFI